MNERKNFNETRNDIEHDITTASDTAKQRDDIARQAEHDARESHIKVRNLTKNLSRAALQAITYDDQAAWEFVQMSCKTEPDEWALIQERLPKLIALQDDPTEIYMNLACGYGSTISTAQLMASEKLDIVLENSRLTLTGAANDNSHILSVLEPPSLVKSHKPSPTAYKGNLLGHKEVSNFLRSVENDPQCSPLLYNISLELTNNLHAVQHWNALASTTKASVVDRCFLFLEQLNGSYADKYSREAEEYPKVMKLLAIEAGADKAMRYYDQLGTLVSWREMVLRIRDTTSRNNTTADKILYDAYFSWQRIKENRGWEMP